MENDLTLTARDQQLFAMMERASENGAKRALEKVGLGDVHAAKDMSDIRGILESYREVKKGMLNTLGKIVMTGVIAALVAYFWYKH